MSSDQVIHGSKSLELPRQEEALKEGPPPQLRLPAPHQPGFVDALVKLLS